MNPNTPELIFNKLIAMLKGRKLPDGHPLHKRNFFDSLQFIANIHIFAPILSRLEERGFNLDAMASDDPKTVEEQQKHWGFVCGILEQMLPEILAGRNYAPDIAYSKEHLEMLLLPYQEIAQSGHVEATGTKSIKNAILAGEGFNPVQWLTEGDLDILLRSINLPEIKYTFLSPVAIACAIELAMIDKKDTQETYSIPLLINNASNQGQRGSHWRCAMVTVHAGDPLTITARLEDDSPLSEASKQELKTALTQAITTALTDVRSKPALVERYEGYTVGDVQVESKGQNAQGHACLDFSLYNLLMMYCRDSQNELVRAILETGAHGAHPDAGVLRKVILKNLLSSLRISEAVFYGDQRPEAHPSLRVSQVNEAVRDEFIESDEGGYQLKADYIDLLMSSITPAELNFVAMLGEQSPKPSAFLKLSRDAITKKVEANGKLLEYKQEYEGKFNLNAFATSTAIDISATLFFSAGNLQAIIQEIDSQPNCRELALRSGEQNKCELGSHFNEILLLKNVTRFKVPRSKFSQEFHDKLSILGVINELALTQYVLSQEALASYQEKLKDMNFHSTPVSVSLASCLDKQDDIHTCLAKLRLLIATINRETKNKIVIEISIENANDFFRDSPLIHDLRVLAMFAELKSPFVFVRASSDIVKVSRHVQAIQVARETAHQASIQAVRQGRPKPSQSHGVHRKPLTFVEYLGAGEINIRDYLGSEASEWPLRVKALTEIINEKHQPCSDTLKLIGLAKEHIDSLKALISGLTTVTHIEVETSPEDKAQLTSISEALELRNKSLAFLGIRAESTETAWFNFLMARLNQSFGSDRSRAGQSGLNFMIEGNLEALSNISSFNRFDFNKRLILSPAEFLKGFLSACNAFQNKSEFKVGKLSFNIKDVDVTSFDGVFSAEQHEQYNLQIVDLMKKHFDAKGYLPFSIAEFLMPIGSAVSDAFYLALKELLLALQKNDFSLKLVLASQKGSQKFSTVQLVDLHSFYRKHRLGVELDIKSDSLEEGASLLYKDIINTIAINRRAIHAKQYQSSAEASLVKAVEQSNKPSEPIAHHLIRACKLSDVAIGIEVSEEMEATVEAQTSTSVDDDQEFFMDTTVSTVIAPVNPELDLNALITRADIEKMLAIPGFFESYQKRAYGNLGDQGARFEADKDNDYIVQHNRQLGKTEILHNQYFSPKNKEVSGQSEYFLRQLLSLQDASRFTQTLNALTPAAFAAVAEHQTVFEGTVDLENLPDGFMLGEYQDPQDAKIKLMLDYDPLKINLAKTPLTQTLKKREPYSFLGDMMQFLSDAQVDDLIRFTNPGTEEIHDKARESYISSYIGWGASKKTGKTFDQLKFIMDVMNRDLADKIERQYPWAFGKAQSLVFPNQSTQLKALFSIVHYAGLEGLDAFLSALDTLRAKSIPAFNAMVKNFIAVRDVNNLADLTTSESLKTIQKIALLSDAEQDLWNKLLNKHFEFNDQGYSATGHHTGLVELFNGFSYFIKTLKDSGLSLPNSFVEQINGVNCPNMMVFMDRVLRVITKAAPRYRQHQLNNLNNLDWTNQGVVYAAVHNGYRFVHESMRLESAFGYEAGKLKDNYKLFLTVIRQHKNNTIMTMDYSIDPYQVDYSDLEAMVKNSSEIVSIKHSFNFIPVLFTRYLGCTADAIHAREFHKYLELQRKLDVVGESVIPSDNPKYLRFKVELHAIAAIATTGRGAKDFRSDEFVRFIRALGAANFENFDLYDETYHEVNVFIVELFRDDSLDKPSLDEITGLLRLLYNTSVEDQKFVFELIHKNASIDLWKALDRWNKNPSRVSESMVVSMLKRFQLLQTDDNIASAVSCADVMGCIHFEAQGDSEVFSAELQTVVDLLLSHPLRNHIIDYMRQIKLGEMNPELLSPRNLMDIVNKLIGVNELPRLKAILRDRLPLVRKTADAAAESTLLESVAPKSGFRARLVKYLNANQDTYLGYLTKEPLSLKPIATIEGLTEENVVQQLVGKIQEIYDRTTRMNFSVRTLLQALSGDAYFVTNKALSFLLSVAAKASKAPDLTKDKVNQQVIAFITQFIYELSPASNPEQQSNDVKIILKAYAGDIPAVALGSLDAYFPLIAAYIEKAEPVLTALSGLNKAWQASVAKIDLSQLKTLEPALFAQLLEILPKFKVDESLSAVVLRNPSLVDAKAIGIFKKAMTVIAEALEIFEYQPQVYKTIFTSPALGDPSKMAGFAASVAEVLQNEKISLAVRNRIIGLVADKPGLDLDAMISVIQTACEQQSTLQDRIIPMIVAVASQDGIGSTELKKAFSWVREFSNGDERISLLLDLCENDAHKVLVIIENCPAGFALQDYLSVLLLTREAVENSQDKSTVFRALLAAKVGELMAQLKPLCLEQFKLLAGLYQKKPYPQLKKLQEMLAKYQDRSGFENAIASFDRDPSGLFDRNADKDFVNQGDINKLYVDELKGQFPRIMADLKVIGLNGYKRSLFKTEKDTILRDLVYINESSLNSYAKLSSVDLEQAFKDLRVLLRDQEADSKERYKKRLDLIALIREAYRRSSGGKLPRLVQLLPLLLAADGNALTQVKTGEGKTMITALQAVMKHAQGGPVVVATSDSSLAFDGVRENDAFFKYLGIESGSISAGSDIADYQSNGIYYAEFSELALFFQKQELALDKEIDNKMHLIIDEFDFPAFDSPSTSRYARNLSGAEDVSDVVRDAYQLIFDFVSKPQFIADKCTAAQDIVNLKAYAIDPQNRATEAVKNTLLNFSEEELNELIDDAYAVKQVLNTPKKPFELRIVTRQSKAKDKDEATGFEERFLDAGVLKSDGRTAPNNSRFSRYVHPILHAVLARSFKEKRLDDALYTSYIAPLVGADHSVKPPRVTAMRHTLSQMNANAMFLRYLRQDSGSDVYGLTGTLGADKLSALAVNAGTRAYIIPPYKQSKMTIVPTIIASPESISRLGLKSRILSFFRTRSNAELVDKEVLRAAAQEAHLAKIVEIALKEQAVGNPVLLFAETDDYAVKIQEALNVAIKELTNKPTIQSYVRESGDTPEKRKTYEEGIVKQAAKANTITITKLLARGTDIAPASGSLAVIDTSLWAEADQRGHDQRKGRTARNGKLGNVYLILSENEFLDRGLVIPKTPEETEVAIASIRAHVAIQKGDDWFIKNESASVFTQIQDAYIQFMRKLSHVFEVNYQNMGLDAQLKKDWKTAQDASWRAWATCYKQLEKNWDAQAGAIRNKLHGFDLQRDPQLTREQFLQDTVQESIKTFIRLAKGGLWDALCAEVLTDTNEVYERAYTDYLADMTDKREAAVEPIMSLAVQIRDLDNQVKALTQELENLVAPDSLQETASLEAESAKLETGLDAEIGKKQNEHDAAAQALQDAQQVEQKSQAQRKTFFAKAAAAVQGVFASIAQKTASMQKQQARAKEAQALLLTKKDSFQEQRAQLEAKIAGVSADKQASLDRLSSSYQTLEIPSEYSVAETLTLDQLNLQDSSAEVTAMPVPVARSYHPLVQHFSIEASIPSIAQVQVALGDESPGAKQRALREVLKTIFVFDISVLDRDVSLGATDTFYHKQLQELLKLALNTLLKDSVQTKNPATSTAIKRQYWAILEGVKRYGDDAAKGVVYDMHLAFVRDVLPAEERREKAGVIDSDIDPFSTVDAAEPELDAKEIAQRYQRLRQDYVRHLYDLGDQGFLPAGYDAKSTHFAREKLFYPENDAQRLWDDLCEYVRGEISDYKSAWWKSGDRKAAIKDLEAALKDLTYQNTPRKTEYLIRKLDELSQKALEKDYEIDQTRTLKNFRNSNGGSRFQKMLARIRDKAMGSLSTDEAVYRAQVSSIGGLIEQLKGYENIDRFNLMTMQGLLDVLKGCKLSAEGRDKKDLDNYKALSALKDRFGAQLSGLSLTSLDKTQRGFYHAAVDLRDRIVGLQAAVSVSSLRDTLSKNADVMVRDAVQAVAGVQSLNTDKDFCEYIADRYVKVNIGSDALKERVYQVLYALEKASLQVNSTSEFHLEFVVLSDNSQDVSINCYRLTKEGAEFIKTPMTLCITDIGKSTAMCDFPVVQPSQVISKQVRQGTKEILAGLNISRKQEISISKKLQQLLIAIIAVYKARGFESNDACDTDIARVKDLATRLKGQLVEVYGRLKEAFPEIKQMILADEQLKPLFVNREVNIPDFADDVAKLTQVDVPAGRLTRTASFHMLPSAGHGVVDGKQRLRTGSIDTPRSPKIK